MVMNMYLMSFKQAQYAQTFVDYMKTKGIAMHIELDIEGNSQLFIDSEDEQTIALVKTELISYLKNPFDPQYSNASWQVGSHFKEKQSIRLNLGLPKIISAGKLTTSITLICILVFVLSTIMGPDQILDYIGYPTVGHFYEIWRYFTPALIHFSVIHIVSNLMWWWYLGGMIEKNRGTFKLLELLLFAGILSNYATGIISGPSFGGLSGVVYALMGYVWLYGEKVKSSPMRFDRTMMFFALIWLVAGYLGWLGSIANTAHLIGLIIGLLLAAKDIWFIKK